jgi:hypothetical protein
MGTRLVLGASTLSLVVLASGGTAVLVNHGARQLQHPPLSAPVPIAGPRPGPSPLVVHRSPGSALFGPSRPVRHQVVPVPAAVQLPHVARPVVPPVAGPPVVVAPPVVVPPVVEPPVVEPPVVEPPVVEPPVVEPPVVEPPVVAEPPAAERHTADKGKGRGGHWPKGDKGHHHGQGKDHKH